ncbi:phage head closure protein [Rhodoplanes sp. TEM]|uniref:Phage head closure protein n=1 Tax=Rhodoplanes tepidamans TaxID=200616 RepID=A0ABT5JE91_RHOTP|nr:MULTISPECIES: phage head closure protein [Rhodoplanes]MDC7787594.1 phage head closure protein [Rhodoplanes tepidamans]MDC7986881.1 phage head closure protein [Rhodoplanes sp. TEM]MDQ0358022.1 SPP1 family predicted phage head-tail adaptor [Rhodoplanes tepidamans]
MTPDPGRLRRRLVLEAPAETADGAGGVLRTYAPVATLWAAVEPRSARAAVEADGDGAAITHRILLRAGPAIGTRHRFRLGTRVFRVLAVRDHDPAGRFLAIDAEERAD